jgi:hypothetical protein
LLHNKPETLQAEGSTQTLELAVFTQAVPELLHFCSWEINPQDDGVGVGLDPPQLEPVVQIPE